MGGKIPLFLVGNTHIFLATCHYNWVFLQNKAMGGVEEHQGGWATTKVEVEGLEKVKLEWLDDDGPPSQDAIVTSRMTHYRRKFRSLTSDNMDS